MHPGDPPPPTPPVPTCADSPPAGISASKDLLLPGFLSCEPGGVFVDTALMEAPEHLYRFLDRAFAAGAYLSGLDYGMACRLLYPFLDATPPQSKGPPNRVRLADAIADWVPERRELYKLAKESDHGARFEYVFSPATLERVVDVPIYGEVDADGQPVRTGTDRQVRQEPTALSSDEFVAAMWLQGIRGGIDIMAVNAAIASGKDSRIDIAKPIDPVPGKDATVEEQTEVLHRDDTPSILPNGKIDLRHFKNHFPQVKAGTCLLKKVPRRLGTPGLAVDGTVLEPETPRDFDLEELAGEGTHIERTAKGEFVFASIDGFLAIDTDTHQVSFRRRSSIRVGSACAPRATLP